MNNRRSTVHLRHLNNRDRFNSSEGTWITTTANTERRCTKPFRATSGETHTDESELWRLNLKPRKSRFKINKSRSGTNHHQLQFLWTKSKKIQKKENSGKSKKLPGPPQNRREDAGYRIRRASNSFSNIETRRRTVGLPTHKPDRTVHVENNLNLRRRNRHRGGADGRPILAPPISKIYISKWEFWIVGKAVVEKVREVRDRGRTDENLNIFNLTLFISRIKFELTWHFFKKKKIK